MLIVKVSIQRDDCIPKYVFLKIFFRNMGTIENLTLFIEVDYLYNLSMFIQVSSNTCVLLGQFTDTPVA